MPSPACSRAGVFCGEEIAISQSIPVEQADIAPSRRTRIPPLMWVLGAGSVVNIAGLSLLWPVNALYMHAQLGLPMTVAGMVLMLYSAAGFLGSIVSGWLYDRVGPVSVMSLGCLASAFSILIPAVWNDAWLYIAVMGVFGFTCAMPFPVFNALAAQVWPEGGRRAFNFVYVANNLGVAVGTAAGGVIAGWSFRAVFIGISLSAILCWALVRLGLRPRSTTAARRTKPENCPAETDAHVRMPWGIILAIWLGFVACWMVYVQWQASVSVYMQSLGFPLRTYSLLWTLNGALVFALQPVVSWGTRRIPRLHVHMLVGTVFIALAYALLAVFRQYWAFAAGMVLLTCGEVWVWPAVPAAIARLTPPERQGLLQGLTGGGATLGRMIGPVLGGILYDRGDIHALWLICALFMLCPFVLFLWYGYWGGEWNRVRAEG